MRYVTNFKLAAMAFSLLTFACHVENRLVDTQAQPPTVAACNCCPKDRQKFLIVFPHAGFGNRIQVLASAKIWADHTGRQLIVDWVPQKDHMPAAFHDLFLNKFATIDDAPGFPKECTRDLIFNETSRAENQISHYEMHLPGRLVPKIETLPNDPNPIIVIGAGARFPSPVIPMPQFHEAITQFYRNLKPTPEIDALAKQWELPACVLRIGVHYRAFATKGDTAQKNAPILAEFINELLLKISEILDVKSFNTSTCFFIASDGVESQQSIYDRLEHAFPTARFSMPDLSRAVGRDSVLQQQNAVSEWLALSRTDFLFGSNESTFSDEAGRLTSNGRKISIGGPAYADHVNNIDPL